MWRRRPAEETGRASAAGLEGFTRLLLEWSRARAGATEFSLQTVREGVQSAAAAVAASTAEATRTRACLEAASRELAGARASADACAAALWRRGIAIRAAEGGVTLRSPTGRDGEVSTIRLSARHGVCSAEAEPGADPCLVGLIGAIAGSGRWDILPAVLAAVLEAAPEDEAVRPDEAALTAFVDVATLSQRRSLADAEVSHEATRRDIAVKALALSEAVAREAEALTRRRALAEAEAEMAEGAARQYVAIAALPGVAGIETADGTIRVKTDRVVVAHAGRRHDVGRFIVVIDGPRGRLLLFNVANLSRGAGGYDHPHVFNGVPALGDRQEYVAARLGAGDLPAVVAAAIEFLHRYMPQWAYVPLDDWPAV